MTVTLTGLLIGTLIKLVAIGATACLTIVTRGTPLRREALALQVALLVLLVADVVWGY